MLSFTLISHIGYLVFGLALSSIVGMSATIYYVAHHITIQTTLFLVTGLIERRAGSSNVDRLGGLAKISPVLAILFFIPAMNLAGIPPFSGFVGKLGMMQGGIAENTWITWTLVIASVVTSLLTLMAVARIWARGFWRKGEDAEDPDKLLLSKTLAHARAANKRLLPMNMVLPPPPWWRCRWPSRCSPGRLCSSPGLRPMTCTSAPRIWRRCSARSVWRASGTS